MKAIAISHVQCTASKLGAQLSAQTSLVTLGAQLSAQSSSCKITKEGQAVRDSAMLQQDTL